MKLFISSLLPCEGDITITQRELEQITGIKSRSIRASIQRERLAGASIVSGSHGYRLSSNAAEVEACSLALRHRGLEILRVSEALLATADRLRGQERMKGW